METKKFVVHGHIMEYMAVLHCYAANEEEAIKR